MRKSGLKGNIKAKADFWLSTIPCGLAFLWHGMQKHSLISKMGQAEVWEYGEFNKESILFQVLFDYNSENMRNILSARDYVGQDLLHTWHQVIFENVGLAGHCISTFLQKKSHFLLLMFTHISVCLHNNRFSECQQSTDILEQRDKVNNPLKVLQCRVLQQ